MDASLAESQQKLNTMNSSVSIYYTLLVLNCLQVLVILHPPLVA